MHTRERTPIRVGGSRDRVGMPVLMRARLVLEHLKPSWGTHLQLFLAYLIPQAVQGGSDVIFLMGGDFTYTDARSWFANMDKLVHYVNKDGRVNALYSTPSHYAAAKRASNISYALKTDDFFPYSLHHDVRDSAGQLHCCVLMQRNCEAFRDTARLCANDVCLYAGMHAHTCWQVHAKQYMRRRLTSPSSSWHVNRTGGPATSLAGPT